MQRLARFRSILMVAVRRMWATRWLTLASATGFVAIAVVALSVPLYADAVYHRILSQDLGLSSTSGTRLPPFAFLFRIITYSGQPVRLADIVPADRFVSGSLPGMIGMPEIDRVRYLQTNNFRLYPAAGAGYDTSQDPLLLLPFVSISRLEDHIDLVEGHLPADVAPAAALAAPPDPEAVFTSTEPIEILVSKPLADKVGLQIGDRYVALSGQTDTYAVRVPVIIAGVWTPRNPYESYWFYRPALMEKMLLAPEGAFTQRIAPRLGKELAEATWFANFDGQSVRVWNVQALLDRIKAVIALAGSDEYNLKLSASPLDRLKTYQSDSQALMTQLYTFSVPLFVLAFAFVILVAGLIANSQRNESAVLRSRGASRWQLVGIAFVQSVIVGGIAIVVASPIAIVIAQIMGQTRSFLHLAGGDWLPVAITPASLPFVFVAVAATIAITLAPVLGVARFTIVAYKQERARTLRPPAWQRAGLDILLLIPVLYWTYLLQRQGVIDLPGLGVSSADPFDNPSLFLVPALCMLALSLVFIRLLPWLLRGLAWLAARLPDTALVLAARQLARSPGLYSTPVLLLSMTLSLTVFTSSLAATLDRHLDQQTRYDVGGDARLVGTGMDIRPVLFANVESAQQNSGQPAQTAGTASSKEPAAGPQWLFLPLSDYLKVDGVRAAVRVGRYPVAPQYSVGDNTPGQFLGIDWRSYGNVAYWRPDFAASPLGDLLQALGNTPDGILISEATARQHGLQVGDTLRATASFPDVSLPMTFKIAGLFRLWPTWYPNDDQQGPLFVGNLDYAFDQAGGQKPYDVWLRLASAADPDAVLSQLRRMDQGEWDFKSVRLAIEREQSRPERQGLFGMLSIGFVAATALSALGYALYAAFSFRSRAIELGVLRAIGLSSRQMAAMLACELLLLFLAGTGAGLALGALASRVYIPFLQEPAGSARRAVPFVLVANGPQILAVCALLAAVFALLIAALLWSVQRLKLFMAVKLGETE